MQERTKLMKYWKQLAYALFKEGLITNLGKKLAQFITREHSAEEIDKFLMLQAERESPKFSINVGEASESANTKSVPALKVINP